MASDRPTSLLLLQGYAWLLTLIPSRLIIGQFGSFGQPSSLVGIAAFALWAAGAMRPGLLVRTVYPVRVAVLALVVPGLISFAVMHLHANPLDELNAADRWLLFALGWSGVALLAAEGLRDTSDVMRLLRVVVAGASVSAGVAIAQSQLGYDATVLLARIPGLVTNGELVAVSERLGRRRVAGTATHPLELGTILAMVLGPALVLARHDAGWPRNRRVGAVLVIALALPATLSRSAIISACIVAAFWFTGVGRRERLRGAAVGVGFIVFVAVTVPRLLGTFRSLFLNIGNDNSISMRTDDYGAIAPFLRESPWIGRGPGTFLPRFRVLDNQWLVSLIDVGVIGMLGLLLYFLVIGWLGSAIKWSSDDPGRRSLGQALMGSCAVVIWSCATFDFFSFQIAAGFVALLLGVAGGLYGALQESVATPNGGLPRATSRDTSSAGNETR